MYMPFDLGTVADLRLRGRLVLTEFATPDVIRFRVKVASVAGANETRAALTRLRKGED